MEFLDSEDLYSGKKSTFKFSVKSDLPGFFMLSENYHPQWKATVDGEETEVYVANYLWKGVFVPAGEHEIVFTFVPLVIKYSRWISFFGCVIFILLLGLTFIAEKRSIWFMEIINKYQSFFDLMKLKEILRNFYPE